MFRRNSKKKEENREMVSVGDVIDGTVTGVMPFGAFIDIGDKQTGMVHISEVARDFVKDINEHLSKGDAVKVKVLKIDDSGKISLSIKQALPPKPPKSRRDNREKSQLNARPDDFDWAKKNESDLSFEDKLSKFKQISDENMQAIRRSTESKRSGGYSRRGRV